MQLDKLELDLRPRPNAQALDLGFCLLRAHAAPVYTTWLVLWTPLVVMCGVLAWLLPGHPFVFMLLAWWLRPLLEPAPLYVLSRQVFGEDVGWRDALRAWPKQLGGNWFHVLTWWRPFAGRRCLFQPIWQLEGVRGKNAAARRSVLSRNGTARAAAWFSTACALFEAVLQVGVLAFIGMFVSNEDLINPFVYLFNIRNANDSSLFMVLCFAAFAIGGAIVGPIYTACGFTLYLSRRATLEAWDLEIALRQIAPQRRKAAAPIGASLAGALLVCVLSASFILSPPVLAADNAVGHCEVPEAIKARDSTRLPDLNAAQAEVRRALTQLYDSDDLRGYACVQRWHNRFASDESNARKPKEKDAAGGGDWVLLEFVAEMFKAGLIACAIGLVCWFLYRYRDQFAALARVRSRQRAVEIAGLDIRPESLPEDVPGEAAALWAGGQRRAALALLYRASISRLVNQDGLPLGRSATEGDCLRLAEQACRAQRLGSGRLAVVTSLTDLWVRAAYGDHWPGSAALAACCVAWRAEFDGGGMAEAEGGA